MADFDLTVTDGAALADWTDAGATAPRVNPRQDVPHRRWQGTVGTPIEVSARLADGTVAPVDAALGGRLFTFWMAEYPAAIPGVFPGSDSSVVTFTPLVVGHYAIGARRPRGGICLIHLDAEDP